MESSQQFNAHLCRVCEQRGCYKLSESVEVEFVCVETKATLLDAFNVFSTLNNVSGLILHTIYVNAMKSDNLFFFFQQNNIAVYLCQSCIDSLVAAYEFVQKVKLSDQRFESEFLVEDANAAIVNLTDCDDNDLVGILEADDVLDVEKIAFKRSRKYRKTDDTAGKRAKRRNSPKKSTQVDAPVNFALPHFVITSNATDEETTNDADEQFAENATNPLEILDDDTTTGYANELSPTRNNVKTLKTSAVVTSNLQEITDLCAITIDGDHNSESIYQCKYCPKAFAGPHHLMIHTRKSHQCQYCLTAFAKVTDLSKHVKETHNTFSCLLCGRVFRSNGNLRQHMRKNHEVFLPAHVSLINVDDAANYRDAAQTH